ncbi:SusC/RagA family TonB-linked outer membrane protein [Sphingobacterium bambusae]|uniref:TonB-dependent receptor n=1 Tax=Sphingobacterium bambusae TaxID=662858 RepID=A0ABW6BH11_9SPHI|nr:TonB-dependent receptor [Sphingobacterium bambusae]WPL49485.1 TonB-dependent receptor [Sphingobacterium bambusae]
MIKILKFKLCSIRLCILLVLVAISSFEGFAQQNQKKGVVKDAKTNQAISGVSISIGNKPIASTDDSGRFSLDNIEDGVLLSFSILGYETLTKPASASMEVTITPNSEDLEEVVVVGYGQQSKKTISGAIATIPQKQIVDRPVTSLNNALQGVVPGLTVLARPGDVGSDVGGITLRGRGNLGAPEPLYVIDGVILSGGDFARINPRDVESISVLKDAAAASIYGSRAANGVILVKTKQGKEGQSHISYNGSYGLQRAAFLPDYLGAYDYATLRNEAQTNAGRSAQFDQATLEIIRNQSQPDLYPDNDWYDLVLRDNAPLSQHELSFSGGGKTRYYASGSYLNQSSLFPGKSLERYSTRSNTSTDISSKFTVGTNFSLVRDGIKNKSGYLESMSWLSRMVPMMVNKQSNGQWGTVNAGSIDASMANTNPLLVLEEGGRSSEVTHRILGAINGSFRPIEGLSIDGNISYYTQNFYRSLFVNRRDPLTNFFTGELIPGTGRDPNNLNERWTRNHRLLSQLTSTFEKTFGQHYAKVLVGTSYEFYNEREIEVSRNNFPTNNLDAINAGSTDPANTTANGVINTRAFLSYFSRLDYTFSDKYLFGFNLRHDISSQFAPGYRGGTYPSASVGWRLSQENFMKSLDWVSELKIRGSWGVAGNVGNVGFYDYFGGISTGQGAFLGGTWVDGAWPGALPSPLLTWEKKEMTNIGLDFSLFKNKINIQIDAYNALTKDILLSNANSVPLESGISNVPNINSGKVQNRGVELAIDYSNKIGDLQYTIGGNINYIRNRIIDLNGLDELPPNGFYIERVGQAIGAYYMYQSAGLFTSDQEVDNWAFQSSNTSAGDIKYVDQNNDGVIDGNDRVIVGNDVPYKTYGLNFSLNYKGLDLTVMGQGVWDVDAYFNNEAAHAFFNGSGVRRYHLDRWTSDNPDANAAYPRLLRSEDNTQNMVNSSFWLFDASYFRVKNVTIGYSFNDAVLQRIKAKNLRIFLTTNNLLTFRGDKRMKDFDPEVPSGSPSYPQTKTTSLGLSLTF